MNDYDTCTAKTEIKNITDRIDRDSKHVDNNIETLNKATKKNTEKIMEVQNEFTVEVNTAVNNINKSVNNIRGMIIKFFLGILSVFVVSGVIVILSSLLK